MTELNVNNNVNEAISDIEKCLEGKHAHELKALNNAIKMLSMEHKIENMENVEKINLKEIALKDKDIQIKNKEIQIQGKEAQIVKLENEIELLKIKDKDVEKESNKPQPSLNEKENKVLKIKENVARGENIPTQPTVKNQQIEPVKASINFVKDFRESIATQLNDLLAHGITKFFVHVLQASYKEWFDAIFESLSKDSPVITEKFVLVKVKCKDPTKKYNVFSYNQNKYLDQEAQFDILNKGWKHENTKVLILHPSFIKPIQMKESNKQAGYYYEWSVNTISQEYIGKNEYFIVLCLKKDN